MKEAITKLLEQFRARAVEEIGFVETYDGEVLASTVLRIAQARVQAIEIEAAVNKMLRELAEKNSRARAVL
jgi:hypothetical protein